MEIIMNNSIVARVLIISFLSFFSLLANASSEEVFWKWFQKNEASIFDFEKNQEKVFDQLTTEMHKVDPNLTFEFGPKAEGKREFIISADGIKSSFPKVESLFSAAPQNLNKWIFIKYRPRRELFDIQYNGVTVKADSVFIDLEPDGNNIGITLFIPGFTEANSKTFRGIAYLLLDQALGEYDVETRVGYIEVKSVMSKNAKAVSLKELPKVFDLLHK